MSTAIDAPAEGKMKEGAFAILDCLGFKGAWARHTDPNVIITFLKESRAQILDALILKQVDSLSGGAVSPSIAFVSDTVVIGMQAAGTHPLRPEAKGAL